MRQRIDRTGQVYNRWTVLYPATPYRWKGSAYWTCRCECGAIVDVRITQVVNGTSKGCRNCGQRGRSTSVHIRWGEHTMAQTDWANSLGLLVQTLSYRIRAGWPLAEALTKDADLVMLDLLVPGRSTDPVLVPIRAERPSEQ